MKKYFLKIIVFGLFVVGIAVLSIVVKNQRTTIKTNAETISFQREQIVELQDNLKKAIEKTAISFSITPQIANKVTSAFGSTKNVTLQYYFNLDGKAMIINNPDSVYTIVKEYNQ